MFLRMRMVNFLPIIWNAKLTGHCVKNCRVSAAAVMSNSANLPEVYLLTIG